MASRDHQRNTIDSQLLGQLLQSVRSTSDLLEKLNQDVSRQALSLEALRTESAVSQRTLESLSKLIRDGNGQKPLITRVALLESHFDTNHKIIMEEIEQLRIDFRCIEDNCPLSEKLKLQKTALSNIQQQLAKQDDKEHSVFLTNLSGKWGLLLTAISSIIALILGILSLNKS